MSNDENNLIEKTDERLDFFNEQEKRIRNKNINIREKIVDEMTDNGETIPTDPKEIRLLLDVMDSSDKQTEANATIRATQEANESTNNNMGAMIELMRQLQKDNAKNNGSRTVDLKNEHVPVDIVSGETDINPPQLEYEDFTGNKNAKND